MYAALVAEDAHGGVEAGTVVALTVEWSVVSLVVGTGTQEAADSFDPDDVVAFTVHVASASGALPGSVNVDDCEVVRAAADSVVPGAGRTLHGDPQVQWEQRHVTTRDVG